MLSSTRTNYPRDKTVAELFEAVVAVRPDCIAVTFENQNFSYRELNGMANRLAARLRDAGAGPGMMVGCCVERSAELIVALLAILKVGGAYVPFDLSYPKERLKFFLEDTATKVVLTAGETPAVLAERPSDCLIIDIREALASGPELANPPPVGTPGSPAYVMYTSGSTGRPKGVVVDNRAVVRLVRDTNYCSFGSDDVFLQFAPIAFDASTFEIWGALLNGARLVVMPPCQSSLEDLGRVIREHGVTVLWLTAGLFNLMVDQRLSDLAPVKQLLAGGDKLSARHVRRALDGLPRCQVINGYGPTENTTFTCCHVMKPGDHVPDSVPIGRPISNTTAYVLDEQLRAVPPGTIGELYTGGDGVALGYLNNEQATAEKFVRDPFVVDEAARMYRTGDLARVSADGVLEFCGRADNQVKISGHRIEPGEIEAALRGSERVKDVCVTARVTEDGSKHLIAYYVPAEPEPTAADLRALLAASLPSYMVPAAFVPMGLLPLTPNGKVDRAALPDPRGEARPATTSEPAGDLERRIVEVWSELLGTDRIGLKDNFFDLGGNSLLLLGVHDRLQKALGREIPVTALFEFTTVRALSDHLGGKSGSITSLTEEQARGQRQRGAFARERQRRNRSAS
jgi:amino acid adenylation domain-containing protein